jgi:hypothetical protein
MIDIPALRRQMANDNASLRSIIENIATRDGLDPTAKALVDVVAVGLVAIHERQALMIDVMLQSNT